MAPSVTSTSCLAGLPFFTSSSIIHASSFPSFRSSCFSHTHSNSIGTRPRCKQRFLFPSASEKFATLPLSSTKRFKIKASEYKFPDPIPEFADAETEKFKNHLLKKLSKRDMYGESVEEVVGVCTEDLQLACISSIGIIRL